MIEGIQLFCPNYYKPISTWSKTLNHVKVFPCLSCPSDRFQEATVFLQSLFNIAKLILITKNTLPYSGSVLNEDSYFERVLNNCIVRARWRCTPHTALERWERTASKTQRSLINEPRPAQLWSVCCTVLIQNSDETLSSLRLTYVLHFKHIQCVWLPLFVVSIHVLYEGKTSKCTCPWIKRSISRLKGTWALQ